MPPSFARQQTGRLRRRAVRRSFCGSRAVNTVGSRRRSTRPSETLLSCARGALGFFVLDHLEDVARPRIAACIVPRRITPGAIGSGRVRSGSEKLADDRSFALLDSDDERGLAGPVGRIDTRAKTKQPFNCI